jgi:hypothetical protein
MPPAKRRRAASSAEDGAAPAGGAAAAPKRARSGGGELALPAEEAQQPASGALAIAHQLKAGSAHEQAAAAQALLADDQQLFPQKRARVLQWVVDALIRSQKACRTRRSGAAAAQQPPDAAEPMHSTLHWRLLAQLVPGSDAPVHADLAFAVTGAADGCAADGELQPGQQQQLLQHVLAALTALSPLHFRPRVEGLRDMLSALCALATRVVAAPEHEARAPPRAPVALVLRLAALAARMLTAALRQSSNMKRNFVLVLDIFSRLISFRAAVVDIPWRPGTQGDESDVLPALDALLSAAMFRPDQLSDYHLAFTTARARTATSATAGSKKGARALASYQSQLFTVLRDLISRNEEGMQASACRAVPWVFACFIGAMQTDVEPAQKSSDEAVGTDAQRRSAPPRVGRKDLTKPIVARVGFDCFMECQRIVEPLTTSPIHALRAAALRSSDKLLATLDSSGVYRQTVDENADAHSRSAVHSSLKEIWRAVMLSSERGVQAAQLEPEVWYANGAVAQCTTTLIKLDHQSIHSELVSVWAMLERMRDGEVRAQSCARDGRGITRGADAPGLAIVHFDACCTELVQQIVSTYQQLFQMGPLLESLAQAIRQGLAKRGMIMAFDVCGALRAAAPQLPCSQLPQLFAGLRSELVQYMTNMRDKTVGGQDDADQVAVDAIVALFVIVLQYCSVDEASSRAVQSELEDLNLQVLGPALEQHTLKPLSIACRQAFGHLRRGAVALEFRLRYEKPVNELQAIRPMSVLGTWQSTLNSDQQQTTDHCDIAGTCVALQRIAVLHDSVHSRDAQAENSRSAQIRECLTYVWRDIDEMQRQSGVDIMQVDTCAKWQQLAANIFLLSKCSSNDTIEKFLKSVVALLSRENTQHVDKNCLATAKDLVQDHRFFELEIFRKVGLAVVADRIQQLCTRLDVEPLATTILSSISSRSSATNESDLALIERLITSPTQQDANICDDQAVLISCMSGIATVMKFVRSVPSRFFELQQVLQCMRMASAVELLCDAGTLVRKSSCRSAWVEARCLLGWSLAIVCTSNRRGCPEVQAAASLIDAASKRFLAWPLGIAEEDWICSDIEQYRDAVVNFMETIAADHSRVTDEFGSIETLLPSTFAISSDQEAWWPVAYLTAFLQQANHVTEARLLMSADSRSRGNTSAVSIRPPQQIPTCLLACKAALERCAKAMPHVDYSANVHHETSACAFLRAMAALLDARRMIATNGSGSEPSSQLGSDLAGSVATATKLLASSEVPEGVQQSCFELAGATGRALQVFEPPLPTREFGCLLAIMFRIHAQSCLSSSVQSQALSVFKSVAQGAGTEHMELLMMTIESELTTCTTGGEPDLLLRVWTATEVLRITEETIRSHSPRHRRLLQNHAAGLTRALLRKIHEMQYAAIRNTRHPSPSCTTLDEVDCRVTWQVVTNAATRNLARLVHYTATSGVREARQTPCLLQIAERMPAALCECEPRVILSGTSATLELVAEMAKMCARDVLQCMPMFISCIRKALSSVWDMSSYSNTQQRGGGCTKEWETAAAQLCSVYELLPKALNASALRRYVPYLLSDYVDATLRHGTTIAHNRLYLSSSTHCTFRQGCPGQQHTT